jgi:putative glutamine amidotransferase
MLLPRTEDKEVIEAAMDKIDGLLLSGGHDVMSLSYGEEPRFKSGEVDPVRDIMELAAAESALAKGMPILGVCRGLQILNVAAGGTLIQDIPSEVESPLNHDIKDGEAALVHSIEIVEGSLLAKVFGTECTKVNSWHHQAVKTVGKGFTVNGTAADGVIEGLEADDGSPVLAVQCHPEECFEKYSIFRKLFEWLVSESLNSK